MERTEKAIKELAEALSGSNRVGEACGTDHSVLPPIINRRTVFIIGAGASNAAASLPLGRELAAELIEKLDCASGERKVRFNELLSFMEMNYGFNKDDFKTILFSLNKIDQEKLVDFVQEALLNKFINNYSYDFIAQLLADGLVDGIINFNFDEVLDRHIQSKFTDKRDYHYIYSDKTCLSESALFSSAPGSMRLPIYIKPHGTISQRDSLRFTRKDFYRIEPLQTALMEDMLSGTPVNLVVVGFRLKFFEFSKLIEKCLLPESQIFIVDKNEHILDPHLSKFYSGNFLKVTDEYPLDDIMTALSTSLKESMEKKKPALTYARSICIVV